jgi:hypothetical protein
MSRGDKNRSHRKYERSSSSESESDRRRRHSRRRSSSSSSSSSESEIEVHVVVDKKKHHRDQSPRRCSERRKSEKCEEEPRKCSKKSSKKCSKKSSKKCSKKSSKKNSRKCSRKSSTSSSSSRHSHKDKCSFDEIYKYYKYRLLNDDDLMVAGSSAYINSNSDTGNAIALNNSVKADHIQLQYHIDYPVIGSPYFVREDGIYIIFFVINSDQAVQFALFVNGLSQDLTRYGNNSGAGQLILRAMIPLKKDDVVVMRNSESSTSLVTAELFIGGLQSGNDATFLIMKIAPLEAPKCLEWKDDCLSKKKHYLFKKLMEKMLIDPDLMLQGFNIHGSFFNKSTQTVGTESNVVFNEYNDVNGLTWDASNPDQVIVSEDGVYKIFFICTTGTQAQVAITINGVPLAYTIQGTNKGAGQLSTRTLVELKKNDVITIKNHTSANGSIVLTEHAGGSAQSLSALLTVFKIAPLRTNPMDCVKLNKYHKKCYLQFREYLLHKDCLQITGSPAYFATTNDTRQTLTTGQSLFWMNNILMHNVNHIQGVREFTIKEDGVYDLFADCSFNEPSQLALFVNGSPNLDAVAGRDSGAARLLVRQFITLRKGDVITLNSYTPSAVSLNTMVNAGGNLLGQNTVFMAFKLSPICEPKPCEKPVAEKPKGKKN